MLSSFLLLLTQACFGFSFNKSKTKLNKSVYGHKNKTFYCGCSYQAKSIDLKSCEVKTNKHKKRKTRLEWEHIVPAHAFGESFLEWREHKKICGKKSKSPRKCARRKSKLFKLMEGDPFNLVPAVGSVNALRSNYSFAEIYEGEELCAGFRLKDRKVMPAKHLKGDIARIYFYMNNKYPHRGIISRKNTKLFEAWNKLDPISPEECKRYQSIKNQFNAENEILAKGCK